MDLLEKYKAYIKKETLFATKDELLLAVSGGADSVVLCELCKLAGYKFVIAHCNFQLRGAESDRDEAFVKSLGERYSVAVLIKKFDTDQYAADHKLSIQVAARQLRYGWFAELLASQAAHYLLTAHHADDNIETLLMNFFKGTGIGGLKAMLPKHNKIRRPLLFAHKEELLSFAAEHHLPFVEDSSNASDKYTRNYFRNKLIPGLQEVFPQVENNLANNLSRFREIEQLYEQSVSLHKKRLVEQKGNEFHIPALKLQQTVPLQTVLYEIIKDFGFTAHQTPDAIALLQSGTGKYICSATHRIFKNRNWLIISPNENIEAAHIVIEENDDIVNFALGTIKVNVLSSNTGSKPQTTGNIATLDSKLIRFPLLLRKWKHGDYFYPLGMAKKKKVSRFLIDQKLSIVQKEKIWVIESGAKIIWVVGQRIDDRFKWTEKTQGLIQFSLIPAE
jgi:tRNA(Ile)-lysidine synthase